MIGLRLHIKETIITASGFNQPQSKIGKLHNINNNYNSQIVDRRHAWK